MAFPLPARPRAFWLDLKRFLAARQRHELVFAGLSVMMPALIVAGFYKDSHVEPPPLGIIYVNNWRADRSDAEIKAQQKIDQAKREKLLAEKRASYQRLADSLGIK